MMSIEKSFRQVLVPAADTFQPEFVIDFRRI